MREETGFTLIELLVVILIIGILAAVAIPSFLSQKTKATDAQSKELARTAETTAETIAVDNGGLYGKVSLKELNAVEPSIPIAEPATKNEAWLSAASEQEEGKGYKVTATSSSKATYTISKSGAGTITRTCLPVKVGTGCPTGTW